MDTKRPPSRWKYGKHALMPKARRELQAKIEEIISTEIVHLSNDDAFFLRRRNYRSGTLTTYTFRKQKVEYAVLVKFLTQQFAIKIERSKGDWITSSERTFKNHDYSVNDVVSFMSKLEEI